jgi:hypothetical protein
VLLAQGDDRGEAVFIAMQPLHRIPDRVHVVQLTIVLLTIVP